MKLRLQIYACHEIVTTGTLIPSTTTAPPVSTLATLGVDFVDRCLSFCPFSFDPVGRRPIVYIEDTKVVIRIQTTQWPKEKRSLDKQYTM